MDQVDGSLIYCLKEIVYTRIGSVIPLALL